MAVNDIAALKAASLFSVDGLNAVVTGGGSGLGAYMTRVLVANGANKVFIIGRREDALNRTRESISEYKDNIIPITGDVTSKADLERAAQTVKSHVDTIDVLFCNSGISGPAASHLGGDRKPFATVDELAKSLWAPEPEAVTNTYHVNVTGIHFTVAAFLPLLDAANKARPQPPTAENFRPRPQIITVASVGAFNRRPMSNFSYGPSKAAVVHLTKQLSTILVPYHIRANIIAPGMYLSEMTEKGLRAHGLYEGHNVEGTWPQTEIPLERSGDEEDMAGVVLWLCGRSGAYINGTVVVTDGGRLSIMPSTY